MSRKDGYWRKILYRTIPIGKMGMGGRPHPTCAIWTHHRGSFFPSHRQHHQHHLRPHHLCDIVAIVVIYEMHLKILKFSSPKQSRWIFLSLLLLLPSRQMQVRSVLVLVWTNMSMVLGVLSDFGAGLYNQLNRGIAPTGESFWPWSMLFVISWMK